ncbi:TIGR02922 family protein [Thalassotalea insulae]|uniref:TIGR02922 family protein n=1 Tax=Thalassotalea insulae TaxID=2056778 RepID=A0ABQ6GMP8_9GAMM|nr:TIGR02922 family protein [Thalassotalea insulae]GLX76874.1 TIGR02922 family protein [Thalassotalea insulae]
MPTTKTTVTILYYKDDSLILEHETKSYPKNENGRIIIPPEFKQGKSILAVCLGEITIVNKFGDRIIGLDVEKND